VQHSDAVISADLHRRHLLHQQRAFEVGILFDFGLLAYILEENSFPIAPTILDVVLGGMLEENFISPMIKSNGNFVGFFNRPIAGTLGVLTILLRGMLVVMPLLRRKQIVKGYVNG
jgi:putative tricarboxylic transport membrane protein